MSETTSTTGADAMSAYEAEFLAYVLDLADLEHPPLFAATVRATGYDPHAGQFVGTPRDPSTGRFVKAGAR